MERKNMNDLVSRVGNHGEWRMGMRRRLGQRRSNLFGRMKNRWIGA